MVPGTSALLTISPSCTADYHNLEYYMEMESADPATPQLKAAEAEAQKQNITLHDLFIPFIARRYFGVSGCSQLSAACPPLLNPTRRHTLCSM